MKIRVIKNKYPQSWYRERIGETFEVLEVSKDVQGEKIYIVGKGRLTNSFVSVEDCVIVEPVCNTCKKPMDEMEHNYGTEDILTCIHCYQLAQES